jgi:hypothetical protein
VPEVTDMNLWPRADRSKCLTPRIDIYAFGFVIAFLAGGFDLFASTQSISNEEFQRWKWDDSPSMSERLLRFINEEGTWAHRIITESLCMNPDAGFQSANQIYDHITGVE